MTQLPNLSVQVGCEKCGHPFEAVWNYERERWMTFATHATNCACFAKILKDMEERSLEEALTLNKQLGKLADAQHDQIDRILREMGYARNKERSHHG